MKDGRPPRPTHPTFTDGLWELVKRCWDNEPHLRPEASKVLEVLRAPLVPHLFYRLSTCEFDNVFT